MVKVNFIEDEPYVLAATGVKISQSPFEKSLEDIYEECRENPEKSKKLVNGIIKKHEHRILEDFLPYAVTLDELSRLASIYLWRNVNAPNLVYGAGIEASLRVVEPREFVSGIENFGKKTYEAYQRAVKDFKVPNQDARYMIPEGTLTRMIFSAPPRYLNKLANFLANTPLNELRKIGKEFKEIVERKFGIEDEEKVPSFWRFWGEGNGIGERTETKISTLGGDPYSTSLNARVSGSLSMYAQLVRQRQFLCNPEPLESIARKKRFVLPSSFPEEVKKDYEEIAEEASEKQAELIDNKDPGFAHYLLLGQEAKAKVYGKGQGVLETSRSRGCGVAQWEIRSKVGVPITRELASHENIRDEIGPRCWREGRCLEPATFKEKLSECPVYISEGKWEDKSLEGILELLEEPTQSFEIS